MPPNNLAVYLSNRCNLSCRYCYIAVNQGEPEYLSAEQVRDAVDLFLSDLPGSAPGDPKGLSVSAPGARPGRDMPVERKVSFLGGEPLLRWDVLRASIEHVRKRWGGGVLMQVFTNGTELTEERLGLLLHNDVEVTVSLDGRRETNDVDRLLLGREGSSFDAAMERLKPLPKDRLGVNMVFTTRTLDDLLSNIEFFRSEGFARISFTPDVKETWPERRIGDLRRVMEGFRRYYNMLIESGGRAFSIANLYAILEKTRPVPGRAWWHDCHNLVLGGDGGFYSCDKSLNFPFEKAAVDRIGSAGSGVDWERRESRYEEARAYVLSRAEDPDAFTSCPMAVYFIERMRGRDPGPALDNFEALSRAYGEPLLALARDLWEHPEFQRAHAIAPGTPPPAVAAEGRAAGKA